MKFNNMAKVDLDKIRKIRNERSKSKDLRSSGPLTITDSGEDVVFNLNLDNGAWRGAKTSEMVVDHEGRKILRWVLRKDFDEDAKEIIEEQLREMVF